MKIKEYIFDNKQFLKNILLTTFMGAVISILNYLFNIYLARNLNTNDFGLYNAAIGILYLIQIPTIAIQTAITKKVAENRKYSLNDLKKTSLIQFGSIAIVFTLIFILLRQQISQVANLPLQYTIPLAIALFSSIVSPISKGLLLGLEKIFSFNMLLLVETIIKFVLGYITVYMSLDITLPILANCLPALLLTLIVLPFITNKIKERKKESIKFNYLSISLIFISYFLINIPYTMDLVLVNPDIRASYGALSLLGKIVFFAAITIASVMFSKLANEKENLRKKTLLTSILFTTFIGISISIMYFFFKDEIVYIVFKGLYSEISPYISHYGILMTGYAISYMVITSLLVKETYIHIYILALISIFQYVLFKINNTTLNDAFVNQVWVYSVLTIFTLIILIYYILNNGKNIKREIER